MVSQTLLIVTHALCLEKSHWQLQQFRQIVAKYVYADTGTHIQTHMTADKPHEKSAYENKYLGKQDIQDKSHVPHTYAIVHHCLGKKGSYERQKHTEQHTECRL